MKKIYLIITVIFLLIGCAASSPPPSAEEIAMQRELMQMMMSRAKAASPTSVSQAVSEVPVQLISENDLRSQILSLGQNTMGNWASFEPGPDGFKVNGMQVISPYGRVITHSGDPETGRVVYFIETAKNQLRVEMLQAFSPQQRVFLGSLVQDGYSWSFTSVTGQKISGDKPNPTSEGVLMSRAKAGFHYIAGQGIDSFSVPDGFHVASFQPGEIGSTSYLLLERDADNSGDNPIAGLIGVGKSVGNLFGVTEIQDYLMFNIKSGKAMPLNLSLDDKETVQLTGCVKRNNYVNECSGVNSYTSIWDADGGRNWSHPYWRLKWLKSAIGPVLIVTDGAMQTKIVVVDLERDKRYLAFSRMMGINEFNVSRNANGRIQINAQLGFSHKSIDDLDSWLANATPM